MFIFLKCKPLNTVTDGADHSVDIVGRLAWHFHGGGIYKRKDKKTKNYTRFGKLERHVQRLCEEIAPILFDGGVINTCIAIRLVKCWRTYHTTQQGYATDQRTFSIHKLTTSIGKWMSWSRRGRGKAGGIINFRELVQPLWSRTQN